MLTFIWKIENFTLYDSQCGRKITSPTFTNKSLSETKWAVDFYLRGNRTKGKCTDHISIFLARDNYVFTEKNINYKIKLIDGNGVILRTVEAKNNFQPSISHGSPWFFRNDQIFRQMYDWREDILTICCEIWSDEKKEIATECYARTRVGFHELSFNWNPSFPGSSDWSEIKTCSGLPIPIKIILTAPNDDLEINIRRTETELKESRTIFCKFSLLDKNGLEYNSKRCSHFFDHTDEINSWKFPSFLTKEMLKDRKININQSNSFHLKCLVRIAETDLISSIENYNSYILPEITINPSENMYLSLHDNLQDMLVQKKHCDVDLRVSGRTIQAHKALLSARSPVFSAMFDQDMLENKTGIVDIIDVDFNTMNTLLECMYTGTVNELDYESASKLIIAADKYQVWSLKSKCSTFLISTLSTVNVCDILSLSDMIGCIPLKTSAMGYIEQNYKVIFSSVEWSKWVETNHKLASEVLLRVSKSL